MLVEYMESNRKLTPQELKLIQELFQKARQSASEIDWTELRAVEMKDGNMGSLQLYPQGTLGIPRRFKAYISESIFADEDGVSVIASLSIDENDKLLELDLWKTDFNPLIRLPLLL